MSGPIPLSWESQIDKYRQRGMSIGDNDVEKLKNISYYRLKEFAAPLANYSNDEIIVLVFFVVRFFEIITIRPKFVRNYYYFYPNLS